MVTSESHNLGDQMSDNPGIKRRKAISSVKEIPESPTGDIHAILRWRLREFPLEARIPH